MALPRYIHYVRRICAAALGLTLLAACGRPESQPEKTVEPPPTAESVVNDLAERLAGLEQVDLSVSVRRVKQMDDIDEETTGMLTLAFDGPQCYRSEIRLPGLYEWPLTLVRVSDGERLTFYNSYAEEYYFDEEPPPFSELNPSLADWLDSLYFIPAQLLVQSSPLEYLMQEVEQAILLERMARDDVERDRVQLVQETADVYLEVDAATHLPSRIVIDFLKCEDAGMLDGLTSPPLNYLAFDFQYESVDVALDDSVTSYTPPVGAVEVLNPKGQENIKDRLPVLSMKDMELIGLRAFPFSLPNETGDEVHLTAYREKIVLLNFFSSREGGWRADLRGLWAVVKALDSEDVEVLAIDQGISPPPDVAQFLKSLAPSWQYLVDESQSLYEQFGGRSQRLVLINQAGRVVYLYDPPYRTSKRWISEHVTKLLRDESIPVPQTSYTEIAGAGRMRIMWESEDIEDSVVLGAWASPPQADADSAHVEWLYYSEMGSMYRVDVSEGKTFYQFDNPMLGPMQLADLEGDNQLLWLTHQPYSTTAQPLLVALDEEGHQVWEYESEFALNHFSVCDLEDDGISEILLGFNASGGVHLINSDGSLVWTHTNVVNVWNVGRSIPMATGRRSRCARHTAGR